MKRVAIILALLAAFAAGDLVGPTGPAHAFSFDQERQLLFELKGIREALEGMRKDCVDPLHGL